MIDKEINIENLKEILIEVLKTLDPIEQRVLDLLYGLSSGKKITIEDIAQELGLSTDEVSNIHVDALRKMRRPKNTKKTNKGRKEK